MANKQEKLLSQYPSRRRVKLHCPEQSITEPDELRAFSMASIKRKLDQGIIPPLARDAFYSENPIVHNNLQDLLTFTDSVHRQFESLPWELRKLMGHNIHNFEPFLKNPQNQEILRKYGLVTTKDASNKEVIEAIKDLKSKPETPPNVQKQP